MNFYYINYTCNNQNDSFKLKTTYYKNLDDFTKDIIRLEKSQGYQIVDSGEILERQINSYSAKDIITIFMFVLVFVLYIVCIF